ncbi:TonB family protein [Duganella sp. SG902]|uniref:energy transducer TonB n=1 Tax=Duganella sp. SG902 TaxID=2587016 RepID=UPI00159D1086|nr:energy transducer TonB [Duganella sp. SG902]NVM77014.1 TonB family protein [Duganella sp. SG902]
MRIFAPLLLTITALNAAQAAEAPVKTAAVANFKTCDKPEWPKDALRKQQTGTVVLGFLIGDDGKVIDAVVLTSSGVESLDQAALTGVRRCQFRPPQLNGASFSSWTRMQYVWTLDTLEIATTESCCAPPPSVARRMPRLSWPAIT